jgi:hypothetical protein
LENKRPVVSCIRANHISGSNGLNCVANLDRCWLLSVANDDRAEQRTLTHRRDLMLAPSDARSAPESAGFARDQLNPSAVACGLRTLRSEILGFSLNDPYEVDCTAALPNSLHYPVYSDKLTWETMRMDSAGIPRAWSRVTPRMRRRRFQHFSLRCCKVWRREIQRCSRAPFAQSMEIGWPYRICVRVDVH